MNRIVVKIGGSLLFSAEGVRECVDAMVREFPHAQLNFIVGGGDTVESMRTLNRFYPELDGDAMHWRCVALLDATWEVLCELIPEAEGISNCEQLRSHRFNESMLNVVRIGAYYSPDPMREMPHEQIPRVGWETTSDALAWLLARIISADAIVLVKMATVPPQWSIEEAAERGIIDSELARLVRTNTTATIPIYFRTYPSQ